MVQSETEEPELNPKSCIIEMNNELSGLECLAKLLSAMKS